jgi:hypothetical protein
VECELAGETEELGEKPIQFHFAHHKSHTTWPGLKSGAAMGCRRVTAWAMAGPNLTYIDLLHSTYQTSQPLVTMAWRNVRLRMK